MFALLLSLVFAAPQTGSRAAPSPVPAQAPDLLLAADRLHDGLGGVIENAVVVVQDGRIRSITRGQAPAGAIHVAGAELTPGLVDAYSYLGVGWATVEQRAESLPASRLVDTVDLAAPGFRHAVAEGVTCAFLTPDTWDVIGGLCAVVKTAGGDNPDLYAPAGSAARRIESAAALKISLGGDPSMGNSSPRGGPPWNVKFRRPTTRMGVVWVVRKAFYSAIAYRRAHAAGEVPEDPALEVLVQVLDGELPLRVFARRAQDVQTALRLRQEFGWPRMVIEEGTEAYRVADLLAAAQVPVVTGPAYDIVQRAIASGPSLEALHRLARPEPVCCEHEHIAGEIPIAEQTGRLQIPDRILDLLLLTVPASEASALNRGRRSEGDHATPALAALLRRAGVRLALGAAEGHDSSTSEAGLMHQLREAVAWGLDPASALPLVTSEPAALCGLSDRLGSLEVGKDADLVLWSGDPLAATSRPLLVLVDGRIVLDRRNER